MAVCRTEAFTIGSYTTSFLNHFEFHPAAFEVLVSGAFTTVQDYPGRLGYWHVGIPPSGPMDSYGFRVANRIVGNEESAAGLECAAQGPRLLFHHAATIAVAGSPCNLTVNGVDAPLMVPVHVSAGDTVDLGRAEGGARMYLAVKGGVAVPTIFGSRSTFLLGKMGGHLRAGDILPFDPPTSVVDSLREAKDLFPDFSGTWQLRVIPGPHGFPEYFQEQSFKDLFLCEDWKVRYNSTRSGVRLVGPRPEWARESGGTAGLHPSNIHDGPYSIGTISFTGDGAIILTCDGPSLGGFVCFATVITADLWKLCQVKPGDRIRLCPVAVKQALEASDALVESVQSLSKLQTDYTPSELSEPIILNVGSGDDRRVYRQAGDAALLLELGNGEFDIRCSQRLFAIIQRHRDRLLPGTLEITPGVRSLHIQYDSRHFTPHAIAATIEAHCAPTTTPSRIVRLSYRLRRPRRPRRHRPLRPHHPRLSAVPPLQLLLPPSSA